MYLYITISASNFIVLQFLIITFMLLWANLASANICNKPEKWLKHWHMGTHLRVLSESFPMNTNITGFRCFSKTLHPYASDESSLSIARVNFLKTVQCFVVCSSFILLKYVLEQNLRTIIGPALLAEWSKAMPMTLCWMPPLSRFESQPGHVRKLPVTFDWSMVFARHSQFPLTLKTG